MIITRQSMFPPVIENPGGERIQEVLGIQAGAVSSHSIAEITIPPEGSASPHYHKVTEESYLILSGTAVMQIEGQQFELEAGACVLIEPKEVHQIMNKGEENLRFLAVCVPAWQPGDSFEVNPASL